MECQDQGVQTIKPGVSTRMENEKKGRSLSLEFEHLISTSIKEGSTLGDIAHVLGKKSFALLNIFIIIPFLQPVPIPVLSTLLGLIIVINGLVMAFSKNVWLPQKLRKKIIQGETIAKISQGAVKALSKIERLVKPRFKFIGKNPFFLFLNGILIAICGLLISPPLPIPGTNLVPALVVFIVSVGMLEEDGLLISAGYSIFFVSISLVVFIFPQIFVDLINNLSQTN